MVAPTVEEAIPLPEAWSAKMEMTLNNGYKMPQLGLGTWKSKEGEVGRAVEAAIGMGYRHIDCALAYANEGEVGAAIKAKIDDGTITREGIFITSKLWNIYHRPEHVEMGVRNSLNALGVDYLDLCLIHWPHAFKYVDEKTMFPTGEDGKPILDHESDIIETWKALEKLVEKGMCKSIGLSNFTAEQIDSIMKVCTVAPAVLQVECHPFLTQDSLLDVCKTHKILMTAYSPLGSPDRPATDPSVLKNPQMNYLAEKYGVSVAQLCIKQLLQRGIVAIPKSVTPSRIQQNAAMSGWEISDEDMQKILSLNRGWRGCVPVIQENGKRIIRDAPHKDFPFKEYDVEKDYNVYEFDSAPLKPHKRMRIIQHHIMRMHANPLAQYV